MTSVATVMTKPSSRGTPFTLPPRPTTILRSARSFMSKAALDQHPARIDSKRVALLEVIVKHGAEQIVGSR